MDKELAQLEEWAVNLVNDYEEELQRTKPKSSMHKRIKRFSGELVANPEAYGELLEMGRSQGMTGQELLNAIRRIEQGLLDESGRGKAPSRKQMMSDVIHHFYAQRTGGDTLRRLGQADRQEARAALRGEFGRWGNVPENLRSLFRAGHLNSDVLKGIEGEAMAELGVTKAGQLDLPKAHTTTGKAVTGDIVGATTAKEAIEGMRPQFEIQGRETQAAIDATQPLMEDLDRIAGSVYDTGMSAEELDVRRNVLAANPEQVKSAIQTRLSPFISNGSVKLGFKSFGALLPAVGVGFDVLDAKEKTERAAKTGAPLDKLQAGIAQVTAVTSPIPEPVSQGINFVGGAVNFVIDALRAPSTPVTDEDLEFSTM